MACTAFSHVAILAGVVLTRLMNCRMCSFNTASDVLGKVHAGPPNGFGIGRESSLTVPSAFIGSVGPTIMPAFSSRVICPTRSSTRTSTGLRQSSYGSSRPFLFRSLNESPSTFRICTLRVPSCGCMAAGAWLRAEIPTAAVSRTLQVNATRRGMRLLVGWCEPPL